MDCFVSPWHTTSTAQHSTTRYNTVQHSIRQPSRLSLDCSCLCLQLLTLDAVLLPAVPCYGLPCIVPWQAFLRPGAASHQQMLPGLPPGAQLALPDAVRLRDRATILARQMYAAEGGGAGAQLADQQVRAEKGLQDRGRACKCISRQRRAQT